MMNRALSIRSKDRGGSRGGSNKRSSGGGGGGVFSMNSLRGTAQPELSKKIYRLIKSENNLVSAHESAARERASIATQLSEWGEQTNDDAISDISDKIGVLLSEMGELEDGYAHNLDDSRTVLKTIRNTEKSVQPSRDGKNKIADEIAKLKMKEPESTRIVVLEQELVRAEAENLVAEAQLTNITRQKLKESYEAEFAATIERAEKQILLAKHGRRLLHLLDDTPVAPGDARTEYPHAQQARQILNDAEDDLRDWRPQPDEFGMEPPQSEPLLTQGNVNVESEYGVTSGAGSTKGKEKGFDQYGANLDNTPRTGNGGGGGMQQTEEETRDEDSASQLQEEPSQLKA